MADFDQMRNEQAGRCPICQKIATLVVDHDHSSGAVRALLCQPCNRGMGAFSDNPVTLRAAADYLVSHGEN